MATSKPITRSASTPTADTSTMHREDFKLLEASTPALTLPTITNLTARALSDVEIRLYLTHWASQVRRTTVDPIHAKDMAKLFLAKLNRAASKIDQTPDTLARLHDLRLHVTTETTWQRATTAIATTFKRNTAPLTPIEIGALFYTNTIEPMQTARFNFQLLQSLKTDLLEITAIEANALDNILLSLAAQPHASRAIQQRQRSNQPFSQAELNDWKTLLEVTLYITVPIPFSRNYPTAKPTSRRIPCREGKDCRGYAAGHCLYTHTCPYGLKCRRHLTNRCPYPEHPSPSGTHPNVPRPSTQTAIKQD